MSTGTVTRFRSGLDPEARTRDVFAIHRPETLAEWAKEYFDHYEAPTLRHRLQRLPEVDVTGLWPAQIEAIRNLETSLAEGRPRALIQMATGSGKTYTAAKRIEAGRSFGGPGRPAESDEWGVIKVSAMTWGEFRPTENKMVPADQADPRWEIRPGDLLLSRANTTEYVGAAVLVGATRRRLLLSDKSLRLVVRSDVDKSWLLRALSAPAARRQISGVASGTSSATIRSRTTTTSRRPR